MIPEASANILNNRPFTAQYINSRRDEKDFIPNLLDCRGGSIIPKALGHKLSFEERYDFILQPEFRVHKKEGEMGKEVLQAAQKGLNLISFDIFRGRRFNFQVDESAFQEGDHIIVSPIAASFDPQAIESRAGIFPAQNLSNEPLQGGSQARRTEVAQAVGSVSHWFGQAQINQEMKILSSRFRGRETDHFGDPKFSLADNDFPEKEAKRIFFE